MPDSAVLPAEQAQAELIRIYAQAALQCKQMAQDALNRGAIGTAEYRQAQIKRILQVLAVTKNQGAAAALRVATSSYLSTLRAVDRVTIGGAELNAGFGGVHQDAIHAIAVNMSRPLAAAADQLGKRVADTFEMADMLEGALGPDAPGGFLGRRVDDRARKAALQTVAEHLALGSTRRDASRVLKQRITKLAQEGTADALQMVHDEMTNEVRAAFIDRAGRRWDLDVYTRMVARTTTREATTRATINRLQDHGMHLVTVSDHGTLTPLCAEFEGRTFTIGAGSDDYPKLELYPPFHPSCQHYLTPAAATFEDFERELAAAKVEPAPVPTAPAPPAKPRKMTPRQAEALDVYENLPEAERNYKAVAAKMGITEGRARVYVRQARHVREGTTVARPGDRLKLLTPTRPPAPPLSAEAIAVHGTGTADRLEAQRVLRMINDDPGPEPGARDAWADEVVLTDRGESKALDAALGPDMTRELNRGWATGLRRDVLSGERSIDEVRGLIEEHAEDEWTRRVEREEAAKRTASTTYRCFNCSRFVASKYAVCQSCGYDHGGPGAHPAAEGGLGEATRARRERLRAERRRGRKRWL